MRQITASRAKTSEGIPIGELSRLTGVNIETIRYYEKIKMLPAPVGGSWVSLSMKSAPCSILEGQKRHHVPKCARSPNITSTTSATRSMIL